MLPDDRVARLYQCLAKARETISPFYDDVFREVQHRISTCGSAGKADIAILCFWKRLRADTPWVPRLLDLPDSRVRDVTGEAIAILNTGNDHEAAGQAREILRSLPGFAQGTAVASAVLTAAAPTRLAVYDKRAHTGLQKVELELTDKAPFFYARYLALIEQCRMEAADIGHRWTARDVDLALFVLGGK
jgi:hypothetical protein